MNDRPVASPPCEENMANKETTTHVDLTGCLIAVARRWYIILAVSIAAAGIFGGYATLEPDQQRVTYAYVYGGADVLSRKILLQRFYSAENILKICKRMEAQGAKELAKTLGTAATKNRQQLRNVIDVDAWPERIGASSKTINPAETQAMREAKPDLILVKITGETNDDFDHLVAAVRENVETIIPLSILKQQNRASTLKQRTKIEKLRSEHLDTAVSLEMNRRLLKGLQAIPASRNAGQGGGVTFQLPLQEDYTRFLPIACQINAVESDIARLEARQAACLTRIAHSEKTLALASKLEQLLHANDSDTYGILEYEKDLTGKKEELAGGDEVALDYVELRLGELRDKIAGLAPMTDQPQIVQVSRSAIRRAIAVFFATMAVCAGLLGLLSLRKVRVYETTS